MLQQATQSGVDTGLVVRALAGEKDAQAALKSQIDQTINAHQGQIGKLQGTSAAGDRAAQTHINQAQKARELKGQTNELAGANQHATQTERDKKDAVDRATGAYSNQKCEHYQVFDAIRSKIVADRAEKNAALQTDGALLSLQDADRRLKQLRA